MALQLDPKEVSLYYDRGNARRESGDWRGALADYDRAVVLAPQQADAYVARGWSRLSAGVDGADYDARVYLQLKGWHDGLSPYMAILAVLGARQAGRPDDAERVLDEALANLSPRVWPVPVLRYLRGQLTETRLAPGRGQHPATSGGACLPGFRPPAGRRPRRCDSVTSHWAKDHGPSARSRRMSRAVLSRIELASK